MSTAEIHWTDNRKRGIRAGDCIGRDVPNGPQFVLERRGNGLLVSDGEDAGAGAFIMQVERWKEDPWQPIASRVSPV